MFKFVTDLMVTHKQRQSFFANTSTNLVTQKQYQCMCQVCMFGDSPPEMYI